MQVMADLSRAIVSETVKATPTAAVVAASALFARDLQFWLQIGMYATAITLAVTQTVIAIKRFRKDARSHPQTGEDAP